MQPIESEPALTDGGAKNMPQVPDAAEPTSDLQQAAQLRIPQFRRDISPANVVFSAADIKEFCELLAEANDRAKKLEYASLDLSRFETPQQALERVNDLVPLEYDYRAKNGDSVKGLGIPHTDERSFPDELESFFISNATYARRAIEVTPLNTVEVFLGFRKPSLKINFQSLPSDPTENPSVINVVGRDEDWVISTADRISEFLSKRRTLRPVIHGSGTYDFVMFFVFLPTLIWLYHEYSGGRVADWIAGQPVFMNVVLALYAFLVSLLLYRFIFQYVRWLFPPMEYYKKSRVGAFVHRTVAGAVISALLLNALYDLLKVALGAIL